MNHLPVILHLQNRRCLIVGGGPVALRRAQALLHAGASITIIAPQIDPALQALPVTCLPRKYQPGDLQNIFLVVIATDDPQTNQSITTEAQSTHTLVNRTDAPSQGDLSIPAHAHYGPITLAVYTNGISASASADIRDQLAQHLDPHWPTLLQTVAPYRQLIQQRFPDPQQRHQRLTSLTDSKTLEILKRSGIQALQSYCDQLATP